MSIRVPGRFAKRSDQGRWWSERRHRANAHRIVVAGHTNLAFVPGKRLELRSGMERLLSRLVSLTGGDVVNGACAMFLRVIIPPLFVHLHFKSSDGGHPGAIHGGPSVARVDVVPPRVRIAKS